MKLGRGVKGFWEKLEGEELKIGMIKCICIKYILYISEILKEYINKIKIKRNIKNVKNSCK